MPSPCDAGFRTGTWPNFPGQTEFAPNALHQVSGRRAADIVLFPGRLTVPQRQLRRVAAQARVLAAEAYEDVRVNGDNPVTAHVPWRVFHRFPVVTRPMTSVWRMMAARSFDDLADELLSGTAHPRTIGEHVALSLILSDCRQQVDAADLAAMRGSLVDGALIDALHDPSSAQARSLDRDPDVWFRLLIAGLERDPSRGFRGV